MPFHLSSGTRVVVDFPVSTLFDGRMATVEGPCAHRPDAWWVYLDGDPHDEPVWFDERHLREPERDRS